MCIRDRKTFFAFLHEIYVIALLYHFENLRFFVSFIAEKNALVQLMGFEPEILAILAAEDIRNSRLIQRKRSDDVEIEFTENDKKTKIQIKEEKNQAISERDTREKGWGVESLLEQANYKIDNEDSMDSFRITVKALLERLNNHE